MSFDIHHPENPLADRPAVLVGCEFSGAVREAFRKRGFNAWSCDLLPAADASPFHIQDDVLKHLGHGWALGIFHPPCTYLCSSGLHWNTRTPGRQKLTDEAVVFAAALLDAPIERVALENPVGCLSKRIRPPSQIIQPWQFGSDASKATCLWLKNLPPLVPTEHVYPRVVLHAGKFALRWANQTDSGQNNLPPSDDRWALRSETYPGIAAAMAAQWGQTLNCHAPA